MLDRLTLNGDQEVPCGFFKVLPVDRELRLNRCGARGEPRLIDLLRKLCHCFCCLLCRLTIARLVERISQKHPRFRDQIALRVPFYELEKLPLRSLILALVEEGLADIHQAVINKSGLGVVGKEF